MNIVCIPYHDWRKIEKEGARTRDAHIINHLEKDPLIKKILVINRPTTYTEIFLKRNKIKMSGELIHKENNHSKVYKVSDKIYVLDYISNDFLGPVLKKKEWFFSSFGDEKLKNLFLKTLDLLDMNEHVLLSQNIYSAKFLESERQNCMFDAWDNFILFPANKKYRNSFYQAYTSLAQTCKIWVTNSQENIDYYNEHYHPEKCYLLKNGVDVDMFSKSYNIPEDLKNISAPIIGFGGKISHLFDSKLFNYITGKHLDKSFVLVGQVLDKEVFKNIEMRENVYYLGDKNYKEYPGYVKNFDIGIVPYVTKKLQHGGDSIKVYEYLAAGLKVVGVPAGGMQDLSEYIYLADSPELFSENIQEAINSTNDTSPLPEYHTWKYKVETLINIFNQKYN